MAWRRAFQTHEHKAALGEEMESMLDHLHLCLHEELQWNLPQVVVRPPLRLLQGAFANDHRVPLAPQISLEIHGHKPGQARQHVAASGGYDAVALDVQLLPVDGVVQCVLGIGREHFRSGLVHGHAELIGVHPDFASLRPTAHPRLRAGHALAVDLQTHLLHVLRPLQRLGVLWRRTQSLDHPPASPLELRHECGLRADDVAKVKPGATCAESGVGNRIAGPGIRLRQLDRG
mmetsp:Transcript_27650/g.80146  ORF Transcript_27650/g.80146 Transcript_27650/m.80146 type:complete len:232 (+) Transcript_27650:315-1010(+)